MWDVKEPKHFWKRVGREVPGVLNTGPMLAAVSITEIVILNNFVKKNNSYFAFYEEITP